MLSSLSSSSSSNLSGDMEINAICDDFENAWRRGESPSLSSFLEQASEALRPRLFGELLKVEIDWRRRRGESVTSEDFEARFPEHRQTIAEAFSALEALAAGTNSEEGSVDGTGPESNKFGSAAPLGQLSRFPIIRLHGRGGLGDVYLARDPDLDRDVALKQLQLRHADSPDGVARFLLEARITSQLEHPGIVPILAVGRRSNGVPYYVMRFIQGRTFREAIDEFHERNPWGRPSDSVSRLKISELLRSFLKVCDAVEYAHQRGIIHRDLKPENIMLGQHGETFVVDWGMAKSWEAEPARGDGDEEGKEKGTETVGAAQWGFAGATIPETEAGQVCGTLPYLSPEQASMGAEPVTFATDIYSLGAILYHLIVGQAPLASKTPKDEAIDIIRTSGYPKPREVRPAIPRDLEAICRLAMKLKPQDRYPSVRGLAADIERWLAREAVAARRESLPERAKRWVARHQVWAAAILAASLVAMATASYFTINRNIAEAEQSRRQEALAEQRARLLAAEFRQASPRQTMEIRDRLSEDWGRIQPYLEEMRRSDDPLQRLRATLVLAETQPELVAELSERAADLSVSFEWMPAICEVLGAAPRPQRQELAKRHWDVVFDLHHHCKDLGENQAWLRYLRSAGALAALDPPHETKQSWAAWPWTASDCVIALLHAFRRDLGSYETGSSQFVIARDLLRPCAPQMQLSLSYYNNNGGVLNGGGLGYYEGFLLSQLSCYYDMLSPKKLNIISLINAVFNTIDFGNFQQIYSHLEKYGEEGKAALRFRLIEPASWAMRHPFQPLDPPGGQVLSAFEKGQGWINQEFAIGFAMPFEGFRELCDELSRLEYRPLRVRPWRDGEKLKIAAVWVRDAMTYKLALEEKAGSAQGVSSKMLKDKNAARALEKMLMVDASGFLGKDENGRDALRHAGVWVQRGDDAWNGGPGDGRIWGGLKTWRVWPNLQWVQGNTTRAKAAVSDVKQAAERLKMFTGDCPPDKGWFLVNDHIAYGPENQAVVSRIWAKEGNLQRYQSYEPFEGTGDELKERLAHGGLPIDLCVAAPEQGPLRYRVLSASTSLFESRVLYGLPFEEHLKQCRELEKADFRPYTISMVRAGDNLHAASIWHRPFRSLGDSASRDKTRDSARLALPGTHGL